MSAESKGLVWISRSETIKKARDYAQYEVPLRDDQLESFDKFMKKYAGAKYDFFFYVRWFLNTHILANGVLALVSLIAGWWTIIWILGFMYTVLNFVMWLLSLKTWACSEFTSFSLTNYGIPFLQGKKASGSDPTHMKEQVDFVPWKPWKA